MEEARVGDTEAAKEQAKANEEAKKTAEKLAASLEDWRKTDLQKLKEKYEQEKKLLEDNGKATNVLTDKYSKERAAIEQKSAHESAVAVLNTRIMLAKAGSDEELQARKDLINKQLEYELSQLPKNSEKRKELQAKATKDIAALEEAAAKRKADIELENISIRLEYVKKGSIDELDLITKQLKLQQQKEVESAEKSGADVTAVKAKWAQKTAEAVGKWTLASMGEDSKKAVEALESQMEVELEASANAYASENVDELYCSETILREYEFHFKFNGCSLSTHNNQCVSFSSRYCICSMYAYCKEIMIIFEIETKRKGLVNFFCNRYDEIKKEDVVFSIDYNEDSIKAFEKEKKMQREKEEIKRKLLEKQRKKDLEKEVLQELISSGIISPDTKKREPIPREICDAVYARDGGKCVYCGSMENLQFDHIIPYSKGGATSVENLQLLCQKCNISKSNKIG